MSLSRYKVVAGLSVSDTECAREPYEGKLGFSVAIDSGDNVAYRCAEGSALHVYLCNTQQSRATASKEITLDKLILQSTAIPRNRCRRIVALEKVAGSSPVAHLPSLITTTGKIVVAQMAAGLTSSTTLRAWHSASPPG